MRLGTCKAIYAAGCGLLSSTNGLIFCVTDGEKERKRETKSFKKKANKWRNWVIR